MEKGTQYYYKKQPMPFDEIKEILRRDWMELEHVWPHTKYVIKAIKHVWYGYQYPADETLARVNMRGIWLREAPIQTPEIIDAAIKENPLALQYAHNPSREQCRRAVQADWYAIRFDPYQEIETCMIACEQNARALEFIKDPTYEMRMMCIKKYGYIISVCSNQTEEECLAAVTQNGRALQCCNIQTHEICATAIKNYPCALKWVENQTRELVLLALSLSWGALEYIKEQTPEIEEFTRLNNIQINKF